MPRMLRRLLVAPLVMVLLAGACGGDDDDDSTDTADTTTSTTEGSGTGTTDEDGASTTTTAGGTAGGGSDTTAATAPTSTATPRGGEGVGVIDLSIVGGNVEGGVRREKVKQGSQVTIRATSDVADELHLHTYDLRIDLVPGQSAEMTFLARIPGVFEVELEERHRKVLELEVGP